MELHRSVFMLGGVVLVLVILAVLFLVAFLLLVRRGRNHAASTPTAPMASPSPSREDRQAVLERLARGEMTQEQAEAELGSPLPTTVTAPPPSKSGCGTGCVIAGVVAVALVLLALLAATYLFGVKLFDMRTLMPAEAPTISMPASE